MYEEHANNKKNKNIYRIDSSNKVLFIYLKKLICYQN